MVMASNPVEAGNFFQDLICNSFNCSITAMITFSLIISLQFI